MNEHIPRPRREPTQAAEGLPRWRWTLAEFERFIELGILTEDDRVELIGGELVPMAAKGISHENVKGELQDWFGRNLPAHARLVIELGWRPDAETYCEPDLIVFPRRFKPFSKVSPGAVHLVIEVSDSTLKFDLSTKANLFSRLGVREYWTVNAYTLETHVHLQPTPTGYRTVTKPKPAALLKPHLVPEISLRLKDLGIDGT